MKRNKTLLLANTLLVFILSVATTNHLFAQSWNITGNANIAAGTNYLGTSLIAAFVGG